jgi:K+-sensing histidine kinase KdpD
MAPRTLADPGCARRCRGPQIPYTFGRETRRSDGTMTVTSIWRRVAYAFLLISATTAFILTADQFFDGHYLLALYLFPIVIVMIRFGFVAAALTTLVSGVAAAFFFYEPIFSFYIADPEEAIELVVFGVFGLVIAYWIAVLYQMNLTDRYSA